MCMCVMRLFFFFSSRRRHTRLQGDWSSDVCSSDLMGLSMVNHFGHRVTVTSHDPETFVNLIIYRVPPKTRAFRAPRFKRSRNGGFVHILRDAEYFEICDHFATPAELVDYFEFRRDLLLDWDPASAAGCESALVGAHPIED